MPEHIQDLPLLVAKSEMEVAPGWHLPRQPSQESLHGRGEEQAHATLIEPEEKRGGWEGRNTNNSKVTRFEIESSTY